MTYRLLMFTERRVDDTAIEQNFGCVRDTVKGLQCLLKVVVVVAAEGCHPGFDFLPRNQLRELGREVRERKRKARTCFRDMTNVHSLVTRQYGVRQASIECFSYRSPFNGGVAFRLKRDQLTVLLFSSTNLQSSRRGFCERALSSKH